jgi:replicative superfamily II helicase
VDIAKECVTKGLLGDENLIVTMPTSAGKTRTVEMAIYDALAGNANAKCAYIVPTRALAMEVEESLSSRLGRLGIKISILYGGYDSSVADEDIISETQVYVLTMEKFDLLSRQSLEFMEILELIVVDEAHEMASSNIRSLRAELIMARVLRIAEKKNIRLLLLSAVVKNSDDFQKWIGGSKISSDWSPTSTRYGYFYWDGLPSFIQYYDEIEGKYRNSFHLDLSGTVCWMKISFRLECGHRLGLFFAKPGNTLIFVSNKSHIVNGNKKGVVDHILRLLGQDTIENQSNENVEIGRRKLAQACATVVGHEHMLVELIKKGVCYHHADLPREIRKAIEKGIRDGLLPLVVSTTTLSKGVNLPLKNCIVQSLGYPQKMPVTEFENTVGRAGRAGFDTEGHILFCHLADLNYVAENINKERSISFIASGIQEAMKLRLPSVYATQLTDVEKWALASTKTFRNKADKDKEWKPRANTKVDQEEILSIIDSQLLAYVIDAIENWIKIRWKSFWQTLCHTIYGIGRTGYKTKLRLRKDLWLEKGNSR